VREGVTNVIRHSRAQHCLIRITSTEDYAGAEVSNDGYPRDHPLTNQTGSGLSGLAERVTKLGGQIEAGPQSTAGTLGFRLLVNLPIENVSMAVR
jgi:two-component system sensor histidine kinase DesK